MRRSVDACALGPIRHTVLLFVAINGGGGSGKVVQRCRMIRTNHFRALLPIRGTYFPMFVLLPFSTSTKIIRPIGWMTHGELERLYETQRLVNRTSDGQIVHGDLSEHALRIDQVTRPKRNPFILDQTSVVPRNVRVPVCQKRDSKIWSESSHRAGLFRPCMMRVFRVGGDGCGVVIPVSQLVHNRAA